MTSRFWVGGTGTWDNSTTTHWAATTGGAGGRTVPGNGDTVTFDASSGGGTVTVAATINTGNTLVSITMTAFAGTLNLRANNPSLTITQTFNATGAGTLNLGSGTLTLSGNTGNVWSVPTSTFVTSAASATIHLTSTALTGARTFAGGNQTYGTLTIDGVTGAPTVDCPTDITGNNTFTTLNISAPNWIRWPGSGTTTITNAFNWLGTAFDTSFIMDGSSGAQSTISSANNGAIAWAALTGLTFSGGGTFTATNSFKGNSNSGITITGPSGGGRMIGG
jgi:hypothetical protein